MTLTKFGLKSIYIHLLYFCSHFLFNIHSNRVTFQILCLEVLIIFGCLLLIKLLKEHKIVSLIVKIILLGLLAFVLSLLVVYSQNTILFPFKF